MLTTRQTRQHTPYPIQCRRRIRLMIESQSVVSSFVRDALAREGFDVTVETHGDQAIPATDRGPFDVVIVDREIPGIDGFDLVTYVRHRFPETPILFITSVGGALVAQAARQCGATRYLEKPVDVDELIRTLRQMIDGAPRAARRWWPDPRRGARHEDAARDGAAPAHADAGVARLWGVVLAGGQGMRLQPLVRRIHGEPRPKQYARLVGSQSLLRRTLERVALAVPGARTVIVSVDAHARYLAEESADGPLPTLLMQPGDRGTAAAIVLPALWIHRRDPGATIAIFPSDHFVGVAQPFVDHVRAVATFVARRPERIVLVGAVPDEPETEYGWIEPAETIGAAGPVEIRGVGKFVEKPSLDRARACFAAGALWNTFVVIARAATLVEAARQLLPELHDELAAAVPFVGTRLERRVLRRAYRAVSSQSFSGAFLERCAPVLGVSTLSGTTWCDWGSPRRVIHTLRRTGTTPRWLRALDAASV